MADEELPKPVRRKAKARATAKRFWERLDVVDAVREIVLIALSIGLAFAINNWNDDRKERKKELILLQQLERALVQDSTDFAGNLRGYQQTGEALNVVLQQLDRPRPSLDSVRKNLPFLEAYSVFLINRAPYESLKSIGFDRLSNDSLRLQLINLYEIRYGYYILTNERQFNEGIRKPTADRLVSVLNPEFRPWNTFTDADLRECLLRLKPLRVSLQRLIYGFWNMSNEYQFQQMEQLRVLRNIRVEIRRLKS